MNETEKRERKIGSEMRAELIGSEMYVERIGDELVNIEIEMCAYVEAVIYLRMKKLKKRNFL